MLLEPGFETLKACVILEFALSVSLVRFGDVSSQLFPPGCLQSAPPFSALTDSYLSETVRPNKLF